MPNWRQTPVDVSCKKSVAFDIIAGVGTADATDHSSSGKIGGDSRQ